MNLEPDDETISEEHEWDAQHLFDDAALGFAPRRRVQIPERAPEGARLLPVPHVESVEWTLAYPSLAEVHDPVRGRQLAIGDIHAETRQGCHYHLSVTLFAEGRWRSWECLDPIGGEIRVRNSTDLRQRVKLVPYVGGCVGRSVIAVDGEILPTYTSWFATAPRGILILARDSWERFEERIE